LFRFFSDLGPCLASKIEQEIKQACPDVKSQIWVGHVPKGGQIAGEYKQLKNVTSAGQCAKFCCEESNCDYGFQINNTCYSVS